MTPEDRALLTETVGKKIPETAIHLLEEICRTTGLDWKMRHLYLIERGGKFKAELSIDGFRTVANQDPEYAGQEGPFWVTKPDGEWTDIPPDGEPYAAKVGVIRQKDGQRSVTWGVAKFRDYAAGPMWKKFPSTMIAKVAEALALRKALPHKLGGLYGVEEMTQEAVKPPAPKPVAVIIPEKTTAITDVVGHFKARIECASTRDDLLVVGQEIRDSHLGVTEKMNLSQAYNERKRSEGWDK